MKKRIAFVLFIITLVSILFPLTAGYASSKSVEAAPLKTLVCVLRAENNQEDNDETYIYYNDFEDCQVRYLEITEIENKEEKLTRFLDLINEYRDYLEPPIMLEDRFSEEEIYLICRCVETEVYQQNFSSKVNVSAVIFNRLASELFPNSIDAIIIENQFAFWRTDISEDTYRAVEYAWLFGGDCEDALWFHSYTTPCDFYGEYSGYTDDAGHHFYH